MLLHELAWGGVYFSPLILFCILSFIATFIIRFVMHKTALERWVWKEAWFDVALYICILAGITYWLGAFG
ncbi:DUF1656 domain-containing protein [Larsenimonas salina]|uniref:DUF1656 domain-containing protein n=1 Tax=Larsenimonas salina TaxID=1295565 RepID=UPI002073EB5A|nr:DUF1656 domain-containing protein [Larsenimonas salina]MCM5704876.1 DUF1656 domain-containing protein [Larsenimonas salina]